MFATVTVVGIPAAMIERANRASFYGVKKMFGNLSETAPGRKAAEEAAENWLEANGIDWNSLWIVKAKTIDTEGTKCPYKAEVTFGWD